jgi:uncharacterized protein DUF4238
MALDHYIARTYLKHWCDKDAGRPLRAYRKSDGKEFPCWPADVCTEPNGDLNQYLTKPDVLGQFRKLWEPFWNQAVDGYRRGEFTGDHKFVLSLGWGSISLTTPTTTGIGTEMLQKELQSLLPIIARDHPPPKGTRLEDLTIEVDPDFAKAMATRVLPRLTWRFYVQPWSLLANSMAEPFLTSDNPSAMFGEDNYGSTPARTLPLSPDLCVSTMMDFDLAVPADFDLTNLVTRPCGKTTVAAATLEQARFVNCLLVQHAGDLVFSSRASADISALVAALRKRGAA